MKTLLLALVTLALVSCASPKNGSQSSSASVGGAVSGGATTKSALISWNASTGSPSGYQVFQSNDGVTYALVATVTTTSALVGNLTSGTTYYFYVRSYNGGGYSPSSLAISVQP